MTSNILNKDSINNEYKKITTKDNKHVRPFMTIPAGTRVCPENRINLANYYITINNDIEIFLDNPLTMINMNGTQFYIVNMNNCDPLHRTTCNIDNCTNCNIYNNIPNQSFTIPKNASYYINDINIDNIGLTHVFEIDQKVFIMPGSITYLSEGTEILLLDNNHPNIVYDNNVYHNDINIKLKHKTLCNI